LGAVVGGRCGGGSGVGVGAVGDGVGEVEGQAAGAGGGCGARRAGCAGVGDLLGAGHGDRGGGLVDGEGSVAGGAGVVGVAGSRTVSGILLATLLFGSSTGVTERHRCGQFPTQLPGRRASTEVVLSRAVSMVDPRRHGRVRGGDAAGAAGVRSSLAGAALVRVLSGERALRTGRAGLRRAGPGLLRLERGPREPRPRGGQGAATAARPPFWSFQSSPDVGPASVGRASQTSTTPVAPSASVATARTSTPSSMTAPGSSTCSRTCEQST